MKPSAILIVILASLALQTIEAKNLRWPVMRKKKLVAFDWNCAQPQNFSSKKLRKMALQKIAKEDRHISGIWGDRAFAFKLSAQAPTVYFVPLICGATGNCAWGIFSTNGNRYLGKIWGQFIYTYQGEQGWPQIITNTRMGGDEVILETYEWHKGRYRRLRDVLSIKSEGLAPPKLPRFLQKSQVMCKDYGG